MWRCLRRRRALPLVDHVVPPLVRRARRARGAAPRAARRRAAPAFRGRRAGGVRRAVPRVPESRQCARPHAALLQHLPREHLAAAAVRRAGPPRDRRRGRRGARRARARARDRTEPGTDRELRRGGQQPAGLECRGARGGVAPAGRSRWSGARAARRIECERAAAAWPARGRFMVRRGELPSVRAARTLVRGAPGRRGGRRARAWTDRALRHGGRAPVSHGLSRPHRSRASRLAVECLAAPVALRRDGGAGTCPHARRPRVVRRLARAVRPRAPARRHDAVALDGRG